MKSDIVFNNSEDLKKDHFFATYRVYSKEGMEKAAWDIAIGQSVGNPNVRNKWESDELFIKHSCKVYNIDKDNSLVTIAFPYINLDWETDGVSQLLCMIQGGQSDITHIKECYLTDIEFNKLRANTPTIGLSKFRERTSNYNKPFLGAIVKPKTGVSKEILLDMVKELIDGGVDFIKEDEILANPAFCTIKDRVPYIMNYLDKVGSKVIYSVCINSDPLYILDRAKFVAMVGGNSVHVNVWSGLGTHKSIRDLNLGLFLHYQRSGIMSVTANRELGISWKVLCKIAALCGIDSIHAGMVGGYSESNRGEIEEVVKLLNDNNIIPALSCGMHPGLVDYVTSIIGPNFMANVGGAIHGHPQGTLAGSKAMRQAIDGNYGKEFGEAIKTWGYKNVD